MRTVNVACRRLGVFTMIAALAAVGSGKSWAADSSAKGKAQTTDQQKIEKLSQELEEMRRQQAELMSELKELKQQMAVKPPTEAAAAAGAPAAAASPSAPTTIGEHVTKLEQDVEQTRKDLATNLGVHIHGLVDASYEKNLNQPGAGVPTPPGSPSPKVNLFRAFDTEPNGFELTQGNIHIDRTVEGGVGFVTDLNFGKVAEVLSGSTHYSNSATPPSVEEFDPTQVYLTYTVPAGSGINLSAGKFVTLLGTEVIKTYNQLNYNESNSYIFTFGTPFTHTGIRANYAFNEKVALTMGLNNGWDDPASFNNGVNVEGQLGLTPSQALSLTLTGTYGPNQANHGNSKRGAIDPIVTWHTPLTGLTLEGEYLYAHEDGPVAVTPLLTGTNVGVNPLFFAPTEKGVQVIPHGVDWQALNGYIIYDWNDKLEFATRGEYFRDSDGARTGIRQSLAEVTFTINYHLTDELLLRTEYRHDESNAKPFYSNQPTPTVLSLLPPGFGPTRTYAGQDTFLGALLFTF